MTTDRIVPLARTGLRRRRKKCPICGRMPEAETAPFCSRRCADEDLRRWLGGEYRIPTAETPGPDDEPADR
jgi:endogenous inhibitor of DNA gyrase (YacG/DUF329 family)